MKLIKNIKRRLFIKRIAKIKAKIKKRYNDKLNDAIQQYKNSLDAIIKRQKINEDIKEKYYQDELKKIRKYERRKYLAIIDEKQDEINRLQTVIGDRGKIYRAIDKKEIQFTNAVNEIGNDLEIAAKHVREAIKLIEIAMNKGEKYNLNQKSINNKIASAIEEI